MKRTLLLPVALLSVTASACLGQDSLDTWEDGIPASVRRPTAPRDGSVRDVGSLDASDGQTDGGAVNAGAVGDACSADDDCLGEAPACLESVVFAGFITIDFPGGYCTETGCTEDADCPEGSACYAGAGTPGCNKVCESDADCRMAEGYRCATIPGSGDDRTFCQPMINLGGLGL